MYLLGCSINFQELGMVDGNQIGSVRNQSSLDQLNYQCHHMKKEQPDKHQKLLPLVLHLRRK